MATPRVKIKRDLKTPISGMLSVVMLMVAFVFILEAIIVVLRFFIG
ncbi:MAG: hypothetical protein ACOX1O_03830 [Eggerthellaceae bacterium]|jgi:hypothetical protein